MLVSELLDVIWPHQINLIYGFLDEKDHNNFKAKFNLSSYESYSLLETTSFFAECKVHDVYAVADTICIECIANKELWKAFFDDFLKRR